MCCPQAGTGHGVQVHTHTYTLNNIRANAFPWWVGDTLSTLQGKRLSRDPEQCPLKRQVLPALWPELAPLP